MLDFIFWIIILYFSFQIIGKFIFPYLLKYFLKRVQQKFTQQDPPIDKNRKEGETNVEFVPETKKNKTSDNIGEYVDYEEIEPK
ncbi:MAG: DUF4834 domain-containing protein [Bacteroidota bacterium]